MTGDHGVATSQEAGDACRNARPGLPLRHRFTKPLEAMLEEKYPLKTKNLYVLQMDNPYLILNPLAFEAAGVSEEDAENTGENDARTNIYWFRLHATDAPLTGRLPEPPILTHIFTLTQMREGRLPDTQPPTEDSSRIVTRPTFGWGLHINFGPYQFPWRGTGTTHFSANSYDRHVPLELFGTAFIPGTYRTA